MRLILLSAYQVYLLINTCFLNKMLEVLFPSLNFFSFLRLIMVAMYFVYLQSLVPARFETRTVTGLVKGHAYSVTAVEEVKQNKITVLSVL